MKYVDKNKLLEVKDLYVGIKANVNYVRTSENEEIFDCYSGELTDELEVVTMNSDGNYVTLSTGEVVSSLENLYSGKSSRVVLDCVKTFAEEYKGLTGKNPKVKMSKKAVLKVGKALKEEYLRSKESNLEL